MLLVSKFENLQIVTLANVDNFLEWQLYCTDSLEELHISGITKVSANTEILKPNTFKLTTLTFFKFFQLTCKFNLDFILSLIYERWAPLSDF